MAELRVARSELVLGGGAGARSTRAQALAASWISAGPHHRAVCIETAQSWDPELRALAERCRRDGGPPGTGLPQLEQPTELAHALGSNSRTDTLIVVDCLSFWLTATLVHAMGGDELDGAQLQTARGRPLRLADAIRACAGPLVLVGNQIGAAGLVDKPDLRRLLETVGSLEQQAVLACERVTLMASGTALTLKDR